MSEKQEKQQKSGGEIARFRSLAISLFINAFCPYVIYTVLKNVVHTSDFVAIVATGIPSLIDSVVRIIISRRIDVIAAIALVAIVIGLILIVLGGSPKLLLVRESFFTFGYGIMFLISLLLPKPLGFYTGRQFIAGNDRVRIDKFNSVWERYPFFRTAMRMLTAFWGVGLALEAIVRTYMVLTMSTGQFLAVSPFVLYGIVGAIFVATGFYMRRWRKRHVGVLEHEFA
jgi:hypothetical protein